VPNEITNKVLLQLTRLHSVVRLQIVSGESMTIRAITSLTALLLLLPSATCAAATPLSVPSDPKAQYTVLDVDRAPNNGEVYITTQRDGKSGTSYAKRLINCSKQTFRYVGDADTLKEMKSQNLTGEMGALVNGSISWHASQYACKHLGAK
jgi:hypothetical protein